MGKCKKRTLRKTFSQTSLSREDAVNIVVGNVKHASLDTETKKLISLFGITADELTEAGATYEEVIILKKHM